MARFDYFVQTTSSYNPDSIYLPDLAMRLDNNCKSGAWYLGDSNYGNRLELIAIKFSKRLHRGNEYTEPGTPIGQLWFVPCNAQPILGTNKSGDDMPPLQTNMVYYTLLKNSKSQKSGSLINFGQKANMVHGSGYDYREVIWKPSFIEKSASVSNEKGEKETVSYFVLDWKYILPEQYTEAQKAKITQIIEVLQNPEQMKKLYDSSLDNESLCIDGMPSLKVSQTITMLNNNHKFLIENKE